MSTLLLLFLFSVLLFYLLVCLLHWITKQLHCISRSFVLPLHYQWMFDSCFRFIQLGERSKDEIIIVLLLLLLNLQHSHEDALKAPLQSLFSCSLYIVSCFSLLLAAWLCPVVCVLGGKKAYNFLLFFAFFSLPLSLALASSYINSVLRSLIFMVYAPPVIDSNHSSFSVRDILCVERRSIYGTSFFLRLTRVSRWESTRRRKKSDLRLSLSFNQFQLSSWREREAQTKEGSFQRVLRCYRLLKVFFLTRWINSQFSSNSRMMTTKGS